MSYRLLFDLALRRMPAETAHRAAFGLIRFAAAVPGGARLERRLFAPSDPALRVRALGREFAGPLGLAAGFDKDARGVDGMGALGFSHVEVGTVTARPQPGNPTPRLFRLPEDRALVNRMGFNNTGAAAAADRLRRRRRHGATVVGVNIGKTKVVAEDAAAADYAASARLVADVADYLVVNVSSPNTPGLRHLQAVEQLRPLLTAIRAALDEGPTSPPYAGRVPLLVKIAPDLSDADVDAVADLALDLGLDGIVATNTTTGRDRLSTPGPTVAGLGAGGLSGAPLRPRALEVLRRLWRRVGRQVTLVGVGGIETPEDAWERLAAGATLLQAYTGFVYGGPFWPRRIHQGLSRRLRDVGATSIADIVGTGVPAPPGTG